MGPSRKRARTKPPTTDTSKAGTTGEEPKVGVISTTTVKPLAPLPNESSESTHKSEDGPPTPQRSKPEPSSAKSLHKASWYGTWPRKSIASTQVARESILADKPTINNSTVDLSRFEPPKKSPTTTSTPKSGRPPSMYLGKSRETSDITMGGTMDVKSVADTRDNKTTRPPTGVDTTPVKVEDVEAAPAAAPTLESPPKSETIPIRPVTSSGWLGGWLGRTNEEVSIPAEQDSKALGAASGDKPDVNKQVLEPEAPQQTTETVVASDAASAAPASTSWFGLWSTAAASEIADAPKQEVPVKLTESGNDTIMTDAPALSADATQAKEPAMPAAGSSWAFWSTEPPQKATVPPAKVEDAGQLAVAGNASQDKPQPAKTTIVRNDKKPKTSKRDRPQSTDVDAAMSKTISVDPSQVAVASKTPTGKTSPPNLLVPSVKSTYRMIENPSILQQIARVLLHNQQAPVKHVFLSKEPPKLKKALAIGIHGLFPAPLLRTVIGQPTGTSIRFANHAAEAIRRWTDKNGSVDCEIEKVALEGEGKIAERVDNLWKLLLNWIDHIRKADFVLVACHSQGVPVALMLVAKLIEFGVVTTGKIGVCAMAGVSLGPFADYKSKLFTGSAGELFEFANPESAVSMRYEDALKIAVKYGVRVTYCGSIDDQLISLESSIFSTVSHPYIFRAVFVDGRIHAPDFLSHLVGFALKLRNLGVSDHGLIRELSAPLAGSLYTGEGHSRLYDDGNVYDLAVEFALETTSVGDVSLDIKKYEIPTNANPYVLPWIMRGLLEEDFVKTELDQETTQLLKQFDDWKPATKVLKDVKYRLEAVRSKL